MHSEKNEKFGMDQTTSISQTEKTQSEEKRTLLKSESEAHHDSITKIVEEVLEDVRRLARYAVETGQLPKPVNIEKLYRIRLHYEQNRNIDEADFASLVLAYQHLERRLSPVSNNTLKATEDREVNGKTVRSPAWRYVRVLYTRTYINIAIILASHLIHHYTLQNGTPSFIGLAVAYLIPFLYGALGADAYVLRETTHKLHTRQFDPRRIPENRARLLLGTLSGGMIVLFVSSDVILSTGSGQPNLSNFVNSILGSLGGAAAGFIAGYSTDFLFDTIERVIGAILPRVGATSRKDVENRLSKDEMLRKYRRMMEATDDKRVKEVYKTLMEDLEDSSRP